MEDLQESEEIEALKLPKNLWALSSFVQCLQNLEEIELRTCRSVIDGVLFHLENW